MALHPNQDLLSSFPTRSPQQSDSWNFIVYPTPLALYPYIIARRKIVFGCVKWLGWQDATRLRDLTMDRQKAFHPQRPEPSFLVFEHGYGAESYVVMPHDSLTMPLVVLSNTSPLFGCKERFYSLEST